MGFILSLVVGAPVAPSAEFANTDAIVWRNRLIVLKEDGSFAAWQMPGGEADVSTAAAMNLAGTRHLAGNATHLWAATDTAIFRPEPGANAWTRAASYSKREAKMLAVVLVNESPLLVYPSLIVDPITGKEFPVPTSDGQIRTNVLRLLASHGTNTMAWFGTGHGEWGGSLLGLNPSTSSWVQQTDALHYVTGITSTDEKGVLVAWSMSHFMAHTRIRSHDSTAKPAREWPRLDGKYYQQIAYSRFDRALYGIENKSLVVIADGRPSEIAQLPGNVFTREPQAIGVAPGIRAVVPVAPSLVVVVPNLGDPLKVDITSKSVTPLK